MLLARFRPVDQYIILAWNLSESRPFADDDIYLIESIFASNEELNHIKAHFRNIPFVDGPGGIIWYGDDARFIAGNL